MADEETKGADSNVEGINHISAALNVLSADIHNSWVWGNGSEKCDLVTSGFKYLDEVIQGFRKGEVVVLASRPFVGKTTFALNIVEHVAVKNEIPVLIFSSELSSLAISIRLVCQMSGVEIINKIRDGKLSGEEMQKLDNAISILADSKIYIDDTPYLGTDGVINQIKKFQYGINKAGLVIIDDMDFLDYVHPKYRNLEERQEQSEMLRQSIKRFKQLAVDLDLPVMLLLSLSSDIHYVDKFPILSTDPEVSLFQEADLFMMLDRKDIYRSDESEKDNEAELIVAKNKRGCVGMFYMKTDMKRLRFMDYL